VIAIEHLGNFLTLENSSIAMLYKSLKSETNPHKQRKTMVKTKAHQQILPQEDSMAVKSDDETRSIREMSNALRLTEVAQLLRVHVASIYRWASSTGVRGRRLRTVMIGGRRAVLRADLAQFLEVRVEATGAESVPAPSPGNHTQAVHQLKKLGLLN
jgi:predicted DNA-binding transcriptional regulator AlpA